MSEADPQVREPWNGPLTPPIPDAGVRRPGGGDGRRWSGWISIPSLLGLALRGRAACRGRRACWDSLPVPQAGTCCCWPATRRTTPSAGPFISAKPGKPSVCTLPLTKEELGSGLGRTSLRHGRRDGRGLCRRPVAEAAWDPGRTRTTSSGEGLARPLAQKEQAARAETAPRQTSRSAPPRNLQNRKAAKRRKQQ